MCHCVSLCVTVRHCACPHGTFAPSFPGTEAVTDNDFCSFLCYRRRWSTWRAKWRSCTTVSSGGSSSTREPLSRWANTNKCFQGSVLDLSILTVYCWFSTEHIFLMYCFVSSKKLFYWFYLSTFFYFYLYLYFGLYQRRPISFRRSSCSWSCCRRKISMTSWSSVNPT